MKMRAEQRGAGYGPQAAAMHTLPHAAHLSSTARGPIQTPDVRLERMTNESSGVRYPDYYCNSKWRR